MKRYLIASAVVVALLGVYAVSQLARVPATTGTYAQALKSLGDAGFRVVAVDASGAPSEPHDLELVVSQDPPAGAFRQVGSTVRLQTRFPHARVVVPDVIGKRLSDAVRTVHDAGLTLESADYTSHDGTVASTIPTAGASTNFGSKVIYTLAGRP